MHEHPTERNSLEAWGDVAMPAAAQQRQEQLDDIAAQSADGGQGTAGKPAPGGSAGGSPSPANDERTGGRGAERRAAKLDYTPIIAGPGGEAMRDGSSPAPRGFTGGAMGKFVAGLSPSFAAAASGNPPPGGAPLYTRAEDAATFGAAPPAAPGTAPD
jgi:hypothetical protein